MMRMLRRVTKNKTITNMRAKKSLGQNFLKSKAAVATMVEAGDIGVKDTVVEIGPGRGVLTEALLARARKVIAIEKDNNLATFLKEKFAKEIAGGKLLLIRGDALLFDPADYDLKAEGYKLIANIPYYITGLLFRHFLEDIARPERVVVMVQKEIAERIVARRASGGKESILSVSVKVYGTPHVVQKVPARYFSPQPKVDSAILAVTGISSPFKNKKEERKFFDVLRKGFAHKRKLLKRNLGCAETVLEECDIAPKARPEEVLLDQWLCLSKKL